MIDSLAVKNVVDLKNKMYSSPRVCAPAYRRDPLCVVSSL